MKDKIYKNQMTKTELPVFKKKGSDRTSRDPFERYSHLIEEQQIREENAERLLLQIKREAGLHETDSHPQEQVFFNKRLQPIRGKKLFIPRLAAAAALLLLIGVSFLFILKDRNQNFSYETRGLALQSGAKKELKLNTQAEKPAAANPSKGKQDAEKVPSASKGTSEDRQNKKDDLSEPAENASAGFEAIEKNTTGASQEKRSAESQEAESKNTPVTKNSVGDETQPPEDLIRKNAGKVRLRVPSSSYSLKNIGRISISLVNEGDAIEYANYILVERYDEASGGWVCLSPLYDREIIVEDVLYALDAGETRSVDLDLSLYINRSGTYHLAMSYNLSADQGTSLTAFSEGFEVY